MFSLFLGFAEKCGEVGEDRGGGQIRYWSHIGFLDAPKARLQFCLFCSAFYLFHSFNSCLFCIFSLFYNYKKKILQLIQWLHLNTFLFCRKILPVSRLYRYTIDFPETDCPASPLIRSELRADKAAVPRIHHLI